MSERIVASQTIDRYGLMVVAGLSVDEALDDYYRMRQVYVSMAAAISVILIGFAAWIMALVSKLLHGKEELRRLSETDRLTGLFNRRRIEDLLNHAVAAPRASGNVAVIFVDLDNFKQLNDTCGHQRGDAVLTLLAGRLRTIVGDRGATGRLGGDEFLVVLEAEDAWDAAAETAADIEQALAMPIDMQDERFVMRASLGIAVLAPGDNADDLVRKADQAMYEAKERSRAHHAQASRASRGVATEDAGAA